MTGDRDGARPAHVPAVKPNVCVEVLDGEAVLYDVESGRPVLLNLTAAAVWAEIDGRQTVLEIAERLAERFRAPLEQVQRDVDATLQRFADLGLTE